MKIYTDELTRRGVEYEMSGTMLSTYCPYCHATSALGVEMMVLCVNGYGGFVECKECKKRASWDEFIEEIGGEHSSEALENKPHLEQTSALSLAGLPDTTPDQSRKILTIGEILSREYGDEEWLIDKILPVPGILALSGMPGGFKTWLTHSIAISVARGLPVFGEFAVKQGPVFFIDEENNQGLIKQRFSSLGANGNDPIHFLSQTSFKIDKLGSVEALLPEAKKRNIKLIVIDSLIRIHGRDENAASEMARVFERLKMFAKAGISVIFTHHHRKGQGFGRFNPAESLRGSSDILAAVDAHVSVERSPQNEDILVLRMNKSRYAAPIPSIEVKIVKAEKGVGGFEYIGTHDERATKASEAAEAVAELLMEGVKSRTDIHEALEGQFGKTAIDDGLKSMETVKRIERVPKAELTPEQAEFKKRAYYRLLLVASDVVDDPFK